MTRRQMSEKYVLSEPAGILAELSGIKNCMEL